MLSNIATRRDSGTIIPSGKRDPILYNAIRFFMRATGVHRLQQREERREFLYRMQLMLSSTAGVDLESGQDETLWHFRKSNLEYRIRRDHLQRFSIPDEEGYGESMVPWPRWSRNVRKFWMSAMLCGRISGFLPFDEDSSGPSSGAIPEHLRCEDRNASANRARYCRSGDDPEAASRQPAINKRKLQLLLNPSARRMAAGHFNRYYPCREFGKKELDLTYLAWLWHLGLMHEDEYGLIWADETAAEFNPADYELPCQDGDEPMAFDAERIRDAFRLDRLPGLLIWDKSIPDREGKNQAARRASR